MPVSSFMYQNTNLSNCSTSLSPICALKRMVLSFYKTHNKLEVLEKYYLHRN